MEKDVGQLIKPDNYKFHLIKFACYVLLRKLNCPLIHGEEEEEEENLIGK